MENSRRAEALTTIEPTPRASMNALIDALIAVTRVFSGMLIRVAAHCASTMRFSRTPSARYRPNARASDFEGQFSRREAGTTRMIESGPMAW